MRERRHARALVLPLLIAACRPAPEPSSDDAAAVRRCDGGCRPRPADAAIAVDDLSPPAEPSDLAALDGARPGFHVSVDGTTSTAPGTGSATDPWSLATALAHPAAVQPGDTIWVHGGTYAGLYTSALTGSAEAPIVVRAAPGEWPRIDGVPAQGSTPVLTVEGGYTWFWGLEIMSSDPDRSSTQADVYPTDIARGDCIRIDQAAPHPGIKIINMVLHDGRAGIAAQRLDSGPEIYGNLIYYNGWDGPTKGYDHGIYAQNELGTLRIADNVVFAQFDTGLHAYAEQSHLDHLDVEGNTFFDGGILSAHGVGRNLLVGGYVDVNDLRLVGNHTWFRDGNASGLGYDPSAQLVGATVLDNDFCSGADPVYGPASPLAIVNPVGLTLTGNRFFGGPTGVDPTQYPGNAYLGATTPHGADVFVRPNAYEPGRAHITIYNWPLADAVDVDVSGVLAVGAGFEVRNAADFFGAPVLAGTYAGGTLRLPMKGLGVATPVGHAAPPPTGPAFNVFVLLPR